MKLFWPQLNLIMFDFIFFYFFLFGVQKNTAILLCGKTWGACIFHLIFFKIPLPVLKPNLWHCILYFISINFFQCDQGYRLFRSQSRYISMVGACMGKKTSRTWPKQIVISPRITRAIDQPSPAAQRFGLLHLCDRLPDNCTREVVVF